jgi:hypothetical protein
VDQLTNDQPTNNQPTAEELKYSRDRARQRQCPTFNMFEVWKNSAPFGNRPIGGIVEALLTKIVNWGDWIANCYFFHSHHCYTATESMILSA